MTRVSKVQLVPPLANFPHIQQAPSWGGARSDLLVEVSVSGREVSRHQSFLTYFESTRQTPLNFSQYISLNLHETLRASLNHA